jgi:TPP-dependent pyruvate/acetoin dehydrogenase alpha subunit
MDDHRDKIPASKLRTMYEQMVLIRQIEEAIVRHYDEQEMRCPMHLGIGQEGVSAATCAALEADDYIFGTYRSHGIYLAKGGDPKAMLAEFYGKSTGTAAGRAGSMQLTAPETGFLCASALVGGTIPMAVGAALASKLRHERRVTVAFFGDAATEEGVWHESMNFASLKKLPVVFVCENNFFAVYTHLLQRQATDDISARAAGYAMPASQVDGNKVVEMFQAVRSAVERARRGDGPSFIEARTYRWREHCGPAWDDHLSYRNIEEAKAWMARDPIKQFEQQLLGDKIMSESEFAAVHRTISTQVEEALAFAHSSPFPEPDQLMHGVYAP